MSASSSFWGPQVPESLQAAAGKWARDCLDRLAEEPDGAHFRFVHHGTTCSNGGTTFDVFFHVIVSGDDRGWRVERAWAEIPQPQVPRARQMCACGRLGLAYLQELTVPPAGLAGQRLADLCTPTWLLDPAGCMCSPAKIAHKWRNAFLAVAWALHPPAERA